MKRFYFLLSAAVLLGALTGCQKDPVAEKQGELTNAYIEFSLNFDGDQMTKADYEADTDPDADGIQTPGTDVGTADEHKVKTAVFYFFKNDNKMFVKSIEVSETNITSAISDENHVKKTTVPTKLETGTYNVYATINQNFDNNNNLAGKTEAQFCSMTNTFTPVTVIPEAGLPMSSRRNDGVMSCAVTISDANTFENPAKVSLYMERSNAKISMTNNAKSNISEATVTLTGYKVVNLTEKTNVFRQVGKVDNNGNVTELSYGPVTENANQVVDPETSMKVAYTDNMPGNINFSNKVNINDAYTAMPSGTGMNTLIYCNENVMATENQLKTYATAIAFKASITPASNNYFDANGAATYSTGDDLWYFGGKFYDSLETLNDANDFSLTADNYKAFGAKYFVGGVCYYTYYIKHYDNFDPLEVGFMEYAIVRNNDYQVTITEINGLGNDVPTVEPEQIEMEESYFQATLFVRPWIVRAQNAVLG